MVSNVSISKEKINIHTSFDTSLISPINCGGIALNLVFPQSVEDLRLAVKYANERKLKLTVLGSLTNTLILAPIIEGLTIVTTKLKGIKIEQNTLVSFAGESINKIVSTLEACGNEVSACKEDVICKIFECFFRRENV